MFAMICVIFLCVIISTPIYFITVRRVKRSLSLYRSLQTPEAVKSILENNYTGLVLCLDILKHQKMMDYKKTIINSARKMGLEVLTINVPDLFFYDRTLINKLKIRRLPTLVLMNNGIIEKNMFIHEEIIRRLEVSVLKFLEIDKP